MHPVKVLAHNSSYDIAIIGNLWACRRSGDLYPCSIRLALRSNGQTIIIGGFHPTEIRHRHRVGEDNRHTRCRKRAEKAEEARIHCPSRAARIMAFRHPITLGAISPNAIRQILTITYRWRRLSDILVENSAVLVLHIERIAGSISA